MIFLQRTKKTNGSTRNRHEKAKIQSGYCVRASDVFFCKIGENLIAKRKIERHFLTTEHFFKAGKESFNINPFPQHLFQGIEKDPRPTPFFYWPTFRLHTNLHLETDLRVRAKKNMKVQ